MLLSLNAHEYYMNEALKEARKAYDEGEVPVGAVIVWNNRIIARAYNQTEKFKDVTAHAEMLAVTSATQHIGAKYLHECTIYITLEPCPMCAGAIAWAQLSEMVFGAYDLKKGYSLYSEHILHPKTNVIKGILADDCKNIIQQFFQERRKNK